MMGFSILRRLRLGLLATAAATSAVGLAEEPANRGRANPSSLEEQFRNPPNSARPRVWWHWMNGNVTKDGIAKDLAWMKRVGIGGLQNFDANLRTPQIVDKRLVYMTPEWKDAFRFAASEADRLGLELAIAASPGWSETGGPWVPPQDGLKKLVWSETEVVGGRRFTGKLAPPPSVTGPFQLIAAQTGIGSAISDTHPPVPAPYYADVAVIAVPVASLGPVPAAAVSDGDGRALKAAALSDADLNSSIELTRPAGKAPVLQLSYPNPQTVRSARLYVPGAAALFMGPSLLPQLEASDDGRNWRPIAEVPLTPVPTTVAFAPVTARNFRLVFNPAKNGGINFAPAVEGVDLAGMGSLFSGFMQNPPLRIGDFRLSSEDRVDRAETKAAFSLVPDYFELARALPEVRGVAPNQVIDLTGKLRPDGMLDWTPPKGLWRVLRLGYSLTGTMNHPATPEATGLEVDKFDGPAVRRYLEHYLGMYKDAAGTELVGRRGVQALLTDSIEVGASNWTPRLIDQFTRLRGYDPTPWLPALTGTIVGSRADSDKFLYDFRRTLADLMASEHYGTVAKVAHENGLKVYGEALEGGRPSIGDDMAMRTHADIPMSAMWTYPRSKEPNASHVVDIKGAASVAHIYGQNLVAAESLTSAMAPWAFGPSDLKRIIDLEFVTGVNRPVIHTSVHVPIEAKKPGLSLAIFGQHFNRNEAWAELATPWIDYISRNSLMLQQGRNVADVGYFYGEEAPLTGLYGEKPVADAPTHYAYDFVNAEALMNALTNEGDALVTPGGARYRVLYLGGSSRRMTLPTLRKVADLVQGGATVVGPKPEGNPSLAGDAAEYEALVAKLWSGAGLTQLGKGRVIASSDIEAALAQIGMVPDFRIVGQPDSEILFLHRQLADGSSYFLSNRKDRAETVEAHFRVTGKEPELWHPETGTSEAVSYRIANGATIVPLTLGPDESVHVVFRKPASSQTATVGKPEPVELYRLEGAWNVSFQPDRGAPPSAMLARLAPLNENADQGIKYFSGIATYTKEFTTPRGWRPGQPLWIDVGEAREIAEVSVNGKLAGYAWRTPYRVDIGSAVRTGRNSLQIRVANLWVNRLIGDAQPGTQKITWTALPTYTAKAPLRPSGLLGPVILLRSSK